MESSRLFRSGRPPDVSEQSDPERYEGNDGECEGRDVAIDDDRTLSIRRVPVDRTRVVGIRVTFGCRHVDEASECSRSVELSRVQRGAAQA